GDLGDVGGRQFRHRAERSGTAGGSQDTDTVGLHRQERHRVGRELPGRRVAWVGRGRGLLGDVDPLAVLAYLDPWPPVEPATCLAHLTGGEVDSVDVQLTRPGVAPPAERLHFVVEVVLADVGRAVVQDVQPSGR